MKQTMSSPRWPSPTTARSSATTLTSSSSTWLMFAWTPWTCAGLVRRKTRLCSATCSTGASCSSTMAWQVRSSYICWRLSWEMITFRLRYVNIAQNQHYTKFVPYPVWFTLYRYSRESFKTSSFQARAKMAQKDTGKSKACFSSLQRSDQPMLH